MWGILSWLLAGLIVGFIASRIMKTKGGLWRNIVVGVVGSLLGGWLASLLHLNTGSFLVSLLVAVGGSCLFLWLVRKIAGK